MADLFDVMSDRATTVTGDSKTAQKPNDMIQIIVSLSALIATAVLLAQTLPQLLNGFP
jgi:hypothetical protein